MYKKYESVIWQTHFFFVISRAERTSYVEQESIETGTVAGTEEKPAARGALRGRGTEGCG